MDIFAEATLAGLPVKSRLIRSATHEALGQGRRFDVETLIRRYRRLAEGGVGAIITGYAGVHQTGKAWGNMLMLDDDDSIPAFREVTAALAPSGTPLILQLAHAGGKANPAVTGAAAKAPSGHRYKSGSGRAEELSEDEIATIIASFAAAIDRARRAGFAAVQLHAAHGYLLSEFLSPALNRRRDNWGGTTENRFRIIREIVDRARQSVGDYPILIKLTAYDNEAGGLRLEEAVRLAGLCRQASLAAIEVSCGNDDWFLTVRPPRIPLEAILALEPSLRQASWLKRKLARFFIPRLLKIPAEIENYNVDAAAAIKAAARLPVIVVGGVRRRAAIEEIISSGKADFVSLCRPFIIEPDLVARLKAGQSESRCINCNYCLIGVTSGPLKCYYGQLPKD
jgi:2,4-dienoyl-CoA reductase-like NADH-dependent reductase (Old Yellow Enzyme family)